MRILTTRTAGWLMIGGFAMYIIGAFAAPAGAYQGPLEQRMSIIEGQSTQWILSKVFDALSLLLLAGYVLSAVVQGRKGGSLVNTLAGLSSGSAGLAGGVFVYRLAMRPMDFYDRLSPAPLVLVFVSLIAAGVLLFGLTFLNRDVPNWLGGLMIAFGGLVLITLTLVQGESPVFPAGPEAAFGLISLLYLVSTVVGIRLARS